MPDRGGMMSPVLSQRTPRLRLHPPRRTCSTMESRGQVQIVTIQPERRSRIGGNSSRTGDDHISDMQGGQKQGRRVKKKPISAGFKDIVWSNPPSLLSGTTTPSTDSSMYSSGERTSNFDLSTPSPIRDTAPVDQTRNSSRPKIQSSSSNVEPSAAAAAVENKEERERDRKGCNHGNFDAKRGRSPRPSFQQQLPGESSAPRPTRTTITSASPTRTTGERALVGEGRRQTYTAPRKTSFAPSIPSSRSGERGVLTRNLRTMSMQAAGSEEQERRPASYRFRESSNHGAVAEVATAALKKERMIGFLPGPERQSRSSDSLPTQSSPPLTGPTLKNNISSSSNSSWTSDMNAVVMERSLSDSSVVTAFEFNNPGPMNMPVVLTTMSDEDAMAGLESLLAKGKGLQVVKHGKGVGMGKSRKLMKYNGADGYLTLSSILPPYFKTKIPVRDVDRVDAKWCFVVVHAKGRSPLRLEVDSSVTADTLRVGLMAASRIEPTPSSTAAAEPPPPPAPPGNAPDVHEDGEWVERRGLKDPEQNLASVRPGHHLGQVYDPDAALSVAALLAKEMEEERLKCSSVPDGAPYSSMPTRTPEVTPPADDSGASAMPTLKRSASMNSVVSSRMGDPPVKIDPTTNRRSLPRGYGGPMVVPGANAEEVVVVDDKASLRRLYNSTEGSGMVAIKRNSQGKGRSRVMVRSKIKEKRFGWAHVLPPFSRKFMPVSTITGAHRASRVVTVEFTDREPVMFETEKLTDALILEQGLVALASLHKSHRFGA